MAAAPRYSLALGGGGARGFAHAGVLGVLDRAGLPPAAISGTSMGALIGALYCAGFAPSRMAETVELLDLKGVVSVTALNLGPESVLTGDRFEARLREVLPATFAELRLPFAAVATDIVTGERVVMSDGDLPLAVRASMSIPVLYEPVRREGRLLVDGGVADPVPVEAARDLGGDPVVAVDVSALLPVPTTAEEAASPRSSRLALTSDGTPTAIQIGTRTFDVASHWLGKAQLATAAVVITPDVGGYSIADFADAKVIIAEGIAAASLQMTAIHKVLVESARSPFSRWLRSVFARD
jgi:NTE family protein